MLPVVCTHLTPFRLPVGGPEQGYWVAVIHVLIMTASPARGHPLPSLPGAVKSRMACKVFMLTCTVDELCLELHVRYLTVHVGAARPPPHTLFSRSSSTWK